MANYNSIHTGVVIDDAVSGTRSGYGTCTTAAATTAKVVSDMPNFNFLGGIPKGLHFSIKFTYNVPASATLNINNTGAKSIYYNGSPITAGIIMAGQVAEFVYDGTNYTAISAGSHMKVDAANHRLIIS